MTKVQRHFRLQRPLDEPLMERIVATRSIYGIDRIQVGSSGQDLMVEYDATRLRVTDLVAALERSGIPVLSA